MTDPAASETPSRRPSTRRLVLTVVGGVALVGLIAAGAVAFRTTGPDPRAVVVEYVEAIRDGDVAAANALTSGYDAPVGSLDDAERITDVTVSTESVRSEEEAPRRETFAVSYVVAGETVETELTVTQVGGSEPRWSLDDSLERRVDVALAETGGDVLVSVDAVVAGETLGLSPFRTGELHLYPGVYALEPTAGSVTSAEGVEVVVVDRDVAVEVPVTPTDALATLVEEEALTALADCVAGEVSVNLRCGTLLLGLDSEIVQTLGIRTGSDAEAYEGVVWTVESSSTEQPADDAWAVEVSAVVRATYPSGAATASVDFPVQASWSAADAADEEPAVTVSWFDPTEG
ncbi:hypothetical protein [Agrococcus jejuensis]|uniref:Uncharacterized protein n=1 Tax=Agrococcus jejuensis TaxID=399736 RepID=A0A1G8DBQ9_9MICO|nr:hypothetical protein [Agrococcus jejuensis]SDH55115.1 hypothetical protein SAMN04489720_1589 [Agrococcus jejuensis]